MLSLIIKTRKGNFINDFGQKFNKGFVFNLRYNKVTIYYGVQQSIQDCFDLIQAFEKRRSEYFQ